MNNHGQNLHVEEYLRNNPGGDANYIAAGNVNYYPANRSVHLEAHMYNRNINPAQEPVNLGFMYDRESLSPRSVSDQSNSPSFMREDRLDDNFSDVDEFFQPPANRPRHSARRHYHRAQKRARNPSDGNINRPPKRRNQSCAIRHQHVLPNLQKFLADGRYADMKLIVGGREITCHYLIMAASSPYFEALFQSRWKESLDNNVEIKGFDYNIVKDVVDYVYGKLINLDKENAEYLLEAADYFQINNLKRDCEKFLTKNIDESNCLRLISFAALRKLGKLEKSAKKYSMAHFFKVSQNEEFLELCQPDLIQYLKDDDLFVEREEHVFDAVIRWLEKNGKPDENYCAALGCVRFTFLTSSFLYNVVQNCEILKGHAGAQKIFQEACKLHALGVGNAKTADYFITRPRFSAGISTVIVMVGGICSNSRLTETDCYDRSTGDWRPLCNISTPHGSMHSYSVCAFDNNIYITGGHSNTGATVDAVSVYLSNINQWNVLSPMLHSRERHGSAALDGCVYVAGGLLASQKDRRKPGVLELVERYRPSYNRWEMVKPLPKRCYSPGVVAYKEKLYIIGGVSIDEDSRVFKTVLDCVQCYDPIDDSWTVRPLGRTLARLSCVHYRDRFYMISNNAPWVYCYDPEACTIEEWVRLPGNNVEFAGLEVFNDHLIISGGQRDNVTLNVMHTVSFIDKTVEQRCQMNRPRCMHGCVVINKFG